MPIGLLSIHSSNESTCSIKALKYTFRGGSSSAPTGGGVALRGGGIVNGGWVDG